jgi:hypothetical protein
VSKSRRKPMEERWSAARSHGEAALARAHTGRSSKAERKIGLSEAARLCQAVLANAHFLEGIAWQLDGIRRAVLTHDLTQEEVEFVLRLRDAGVTDLRAAFDAVPKPTFDEADGMCPNCVTPWKCNGPHLANQTKAANATPSLAEPGGE